VRAVQCGEQSPSFPGGDVGDCFAKCARNDIWVREKEHSPSFAILVPPATPRSAGGLQSTCVPLLTLVGPQHLRHPTALYAGATWAGVLHG
jgi:hypothetical protein